MSINGLIVTGVMLASFAVQQAEPVYHKLTVFVVDRQTDKPLEATVFLDGEECHEAAAGKSECTAVEGRHRLVIISDDATYPIANMSVTIPQYASIIIRLTKPKYQDRVGEPYSTAP